ncbi:DNA-binding protein [Cryobacterium sp. 5B3]|uniref:DNA-binding protein n=1 Tax=Cryobacterium sp. 5B3 TaxID=3048586 RepID=UPI002AB4C0BF|nr:DNA-binding protein [Cryobacterium sp. 5B3]MDY7541796.1 DNA-binding protein [Cryobacterium sp. 5B3]MEB0275224.1 DNA-binding protein [Cryobacterium sp. 5B3]
MRAADQLAAEGASVTAAAVRERSGVRMATAAAAAKDWKAREKKVVEEPTEPVPEQLQARFLAVWQEARALARAEFNERREVFEAKLRASDGEVTKLVAVVEELEQECERIDTEARGAAQLAAENLAAVRTRATEEIAVERSRADRAEGALSAVTAERDRLLVQLEQVRSTTVS